MDLVAVVAPSLPLTLLGSGPSVFDVLREGGWAAHVALASAVLLWISGLALAALTRGANSWLGNVAVALALVPWSIGVLGMIDALGTVRDVLPLVAADQAAQLGAMGFAEAMSPRIVGAVCSIIIAASLAIVLGLRYAARDRARGEGSSAVAALVATSVAVVATTSVMRAADLRVVASALARSDPAQRAMIVAQAGGSRLSTTLLAVATIGLLGGATAALLMRPGRRAATTAWVTLATAAALWGAEQVAAQQSSGLLEAAMRLAN